MKCLALGDPWFYSWIQVFLESYRIEGSWCWVIAIIRMALWCQMCWQNLWGVLQVKVMVRPLQVSDLHGILQGWRRCILESGSHLKDLSQKKLKREGFPASWWLHFIRQSLKLNIRSLEKVSLSWKTTSQKRWPDARGQLQPISDLEKDVWIWLKENT